MWSLIIVGFYQDKIQKEMKLYIHHKNAFLFILFFNQDNFAHPQRGSVY